MSMFLDLEASAWWDLLSTECAFGTTAGGAKLGLAPNERGVPAMKVKLDELLSSYVSAVADAA